MDGITSSSVDRSGRSICLQRSRARADRLLGPLTVVAGIVWAILQPYRLTLLHPHGQGFWWLVIEPPLLVDGGGVVLRARRRAAARRRPRGATVEPRSEMVHWLFGIGSSSSA